MQEDAELTLQRWRDDIDQRTLAEKRRIAPGWLDRDEKILEPEKMRNSSTAEQDLVSDGMTGVETGADGGNDHAAPYSREEAEQLDRFFGGMKI